MIYSKAGINGDVVVLVGGHTPAIIMYIRDIDTGTILFYDEIENNKRILDEIASRLTEIKIEALAVEELYIRDVFPVSVLTVVIVLAPQIVYAIRSINTKSIRIRAPTV